MQLMTLSFCRLNKFIVEGLYFFHTDQFGKIHVPEDPHNNGGLRVTGVGSLGCS